MIAPAPSPGHPFRAMATAKTPPVFERSHCPTSAISRIKPLRIVIDCCHRSRNTGHVLARRDS